MTIKYTIKCVFIYMYIRLGININDLSYMTHMPIHLLKQLTHEIWINSNDVDECNHMYIIIPGRTTHPG